MNTKLGGIPVIEVIGNELVLTEGKTKFSGRGQIVGAPVPVNPHPDDPLNQPAFVQARRSTEK